MDAVEQERGGAESAAVAGAALGPDFVRAQIAQAVSLIADHSLMWILVWWLFMTRKNASAAETVTLLSPGLLVLLLALPMAGTVADRRERKRLAQVACLVRALCHLAVAAMLYSRSLTVDRGLVFLLISTVAGAFFDASLTPMLPQLVAPSQAERALDYSLALPRAGYFITSFVILLLLAIVGERIVCLLGVGFLLLAGVAVGSIQASTGPSSEAPSAEAPVRGWLLAFVDGPLALLRSPKLLFLALLSLLANFVMYPLFWLGPGSLIRGRTLPQSLPENIEVVLVLGVLLGALATPRLCRRYAPEKVAAASLLGLAIGLLGLGWLPEPDALYLVALGLGFALVQITGLAGGSATLSTANSHRARVGTLILVLFELGGELGGFALHPLLARYGLSATLSGLAVGLSLVAVPWLLLPSQRLPSWLRL